MTKAYYSTVFDQSADQVWSVVRDFGDYGIWVQGVDESGVEDGKSGDAVGAIRYVRMGETQIRQRLLAHSDRERCYTYEFCPPARFPVHDYVATIRVSPVVDGGRAYVEWWATFDCAVEERAHWSKTFANSFAGWLGSLRARLASR